MPAPVRVLRVIARLNAGGPAHHVGILSSRLGAHGFETVLVHGTGPHAEPLMIGFDERYPSRRIEIPGLTPAIDARADVIALRRLIGIARAFRPHIVHTHTAKAGVLGRIAALASGCRPLVIHTYHGHVLRGYFSERTSALYRSIERALARHSDCLIGVSQATVDDLVALGVAPRSKFAVVPLGLDLSPFVNVPADRGAEFRRQLGLAEHDVLATFVGRLVPIKRVDLLLEAVAIARHSLPALQLVVVGDGELRRELEGRSAALGLGAAVRFAGYRADTDAVTAATDVAVLSSDNEGTPVALIEAAAAARPAVATAVGGVGDIVSGATGRIVPGGDAAAFAAALVELGRDRELRTQLGEAARDHVTARFGADRLVTDVVDLYRLLLDRERTHAVR